LIRRVALSCCLIYNVRALLVANPTAMERLLIV